MTSQRKWMAALMAGCVGLGGCTQATPYQPIRSASSSQGGYSNEQIEANRFRVSFVGNSMTSRETVETYLLYRAAELTREQGYDWFEAVYRDTENRGRVVVDRPFASGPYGWWGPSWRYYGRFGARSWSPWNGGRFFGDDFDVRTIDRYDASAEIVMQRGQKPAGNARAFDAADLLRTLEPRIRTPE